MVSLYLCLDMLDKNIHVQEKYTFRLRKPNNWILTNAISM